MIQACHYMMESYLPKTAGKNSVHKKSELKKIYENIVKHSMKSGFYKISLTKESQEYALAVKDTATVLKAKIAEMTDPLQPAYHRKYVTNSNERQLEVTVVGEKLDGLPESILFSVDALAAPQENVGRDLFNPSRSLEHGLYDFRAHIGDEVYDLTFYQKEKSNNRDTVRRLADYLSEALPELNITAEGGSNEEYSHIRIESKLAGDNSFKGFYFEDADLFREGIVEFFGLNHSFRSVEKAQFTVNGLEKRTNTNTFLIDNTLQVTLRETGKEPVTLRILNDSGEILEELDSMLDTINSLLRLAIERSDATGGGYSARKLINVIKGLEANHREELAANGLIAAEDGTLTRDGKLSRQAAGNGSIQNLFMNKGGFIAALLTKTEEIAINPMEYMEKTIVTYPDSKKAAANPYMTSIYSGLFFSYYC